MTRTPQAKHSASEGAAALGNLHHTQDIRNGAPPEAAPFIKDEGDLGPYARTPAYPRPSDLSSGEQPAAISRPSRTFPLADGFDAILAASRALRSIRRPSPNLATSPTTTGPPTPRTLPPFPTFDDDAPALDPLSSAPAPPTSSEHGPIQAFALLEFDDGQFYMNTYAVYLGRDMVAQKMALLRELEARYDNEGRLTGDETSHMRPPSSGSPTRAGVLGRRRKKKKRRGERTGQQQRGQRERRDRQSGSGRHAQA